MVASFSPNLRPAAPVTIAARSLRFIVAKIPPCWRSHRGERPERGTIGLRIGPFNVHQSIDFII